MRERKKKKKHLERIWFLNMISPWWIICRWRFDLLHHFSFFFFFFKTTTFRDTSLRGSDSQCHWYQRSKVTVTWKNSRKRRKQTHRDTKWPCSSSNKDRADRKSKGGREGRERRRKSWFTATIRRSVVMVTTTTHQSPWGHDVSELFSPNCGIVLLGGLYL